MPTRPLSVLAAVAMLIAGVSVVAALTPARADVGASPSWVVDPSDPGPNLPPAGRSLFDHLIGSEGGRAAVPYPFEALLERVERNLDANPSGRTVKRVLIPLGRSLQREAAAPDYFAFPRVVAAVDAEPAASSPLMLKDRLYLGYQPKTNLVEVISYNEVAGRFEFQVVRDYAPGSSPRVVYANRAICTSCHQNAGPIFSRPLWDETSANPGIAARIRAHASQRSDVILEQGVDVPNAIDDAVKRANRFALSQLLWREGCGSNDTPAAKRCRGALFAAMVRFRLSGRITADREELSSTVAPLIAAMKTRWPSGLAISDPNIPNRNPLVTSDRSSSSARVEAAFDPLAAREPLEAWTLDGVQGISRVVADLSEFVSAIDVARVDAALASSRSRSAAARTMLRARCTVRGTPMHGPSEHLDFDCVEGLGERGGFLAQARVEMADNRTADVVVDRLQWRNEAPLLDLSIADPHAVRGSRQVYGTPLRGKLAARAANGDAIERAALRWQLSSGELEIVVVDDSARLDAAIDALLRDAIAGRFDGFDALAFRRARVMPALLSALETPTAEGCCLADGALPPARADAVPPAPLAAAHADEDTRAIQRLYQYCSVCHLTADASPPNFLAGDMASVRATLSQCAMRIYARLGMWQLPFDPHSKTPMPPEVALRRHGLTAQSWRDGADIAAMSAFAARLIETRTGGRAERADVLARNYERLPPCLRSTTDPHAASSR